AMPVITWPQRSTRFNHWAAWALTSAASVRGVAEWAQQQRDVAAAITLQGEDHVHLWKESRHPGSGKIWGGLEAQPIRSRRGGRPVRQERGDAAVGVGRSASEVLPAIARLNGERDGHTRRGPTARRVEHVGGDAHADPSLSSRRRVLFICSPAALRSSV